MLGPLALGRNLLGTLKVQNVSMSNTTKLVLTLLAFVIGAYVLIGVLKLVLAYAVPILILGAIGYVVYNVAVKKSLTGGRKTLP